ncbi:NAD-dependent epimerase/dehydratase family protein [Pseudalkalibacillus salsuginis]|uniref:NAD-dependent epimerase/dehydratase family protein n=1 Tax=Pseudalkalibacillus salsuginis TaxID=2910972 RepID=UPI001F3066C7|nr:NAD-dependent epimerase/dehydratase family protein [Pseudalkalibacillus salsuginis]MCF6409544.1 NAD-dependent epimerase/dehydratase family protein [Pseudalkalibacillus salsuginis]
MERILVTGGSEFVSRAIAIHLISKGYVVDILTRGRRDIDYKGINIHHICNRKDKHGLFNTLNEIDYDYDYVFDITAYTEEDVRILTSVINRKSLKGYIFCSSGAVYLPTNLSVSEISETGYNPSWGNYGEDKKKAEEYLIRLYRKESFPIIIFRPPYIYGEGNNLYREAFLFERIQCGKPIPYPEDVNTSVQFVYINDLVEVFSSTIETNEAIGQIFNVAYPEKVSWQDYLKVAMSVMDKEVPMVPISVNEMEQMKVSPRDFFPFRNDTFLMSTEKIENSGLHTPSINLSSGILRSYQWYKRQKNLPLYLKLTKVDYVSKM